MKPINILDLSQVKPRLLVVDQTKHKETISLVYGDLLEFPSIDLDVLCMWFLVSTPLKNISQTWAHLPQVSG